MPAPGAEGRAVLQTLVLQTLRWLALGAGCAALVASRRPDVLLHAAFWGDDGWSWYPNAYNEGLAAFAVPVNGYLNTFQRLVALLAQPLPLAWAPTLFALAALAAQVGPPMFLLTARMASVWPRRGARVLAALVLLLLPNEIEPFVNLTNAPWHLALLAFLVLATAPPRRGAWAAFDASAVTAAGLSGPFCLALLPVALARRAAVRDWRVWLLAATAFVQTAFLLSAPHGGRSLAPLGADIAGFARIIVLQVVIGAEAGYRTARVLLVAPVWRDAALPLAACAGAMVLAAVAFLRGSMLLRRFCVFAAIMLAAALMRPQVSLADAQWPILAIPPMGNRYFFFPMLAWLAVLLTLAGDRSRVLRTAGVLLLLPVVFWAIPHDWRALDFPATGFAARARAFAAGPPGICMSFPILPPDAAPMMLSKRNP